MSTKWEESQYHATNKQRNILIILFIICVITISILAFHISYLAQNAQKQVYIIQVDNETGNAQLINNSKANKLFSNDSIALYFIEKYIHIRENYTADQSRYSKDFIKLFSSNGIYRQYIGYMNKEKENLNRKYQSAKTYIKIKNKMKYNDNTYLIRFNLYTTNSSTFTKHAAIISVKYKNMKLSEKELKINPIGLQITEYKINEEK